MVIPTGTVSKSGASDSGSRATSRDTGEGEQRDSQEFVRDRSDVWSRRLEIHWLWMHWWRKASSSRRVGMVMGFEDAKL